MDDGVRDLGSVVRGREHARGFVRAHIDPRPRRDAGIRHTALGRRRPDAAGREPAGQREERTIFVGMGEHAADGTVERQLDLGHGTAPIEPAQAMDAAIHDAQVEAVACAGQVLDDGRTLRHHFRGAREARRGCTGLDDAAARRTFVGDEIQILAVELRGGHLVVELGHFLPVRASGEHIGERRDVEPGLPPHIGECQQRISGTGIGYDIGHLDGFEVDPPNESSMHQDGVVRGAGAQSMKARAAVQKALRRIDRAGQLVIEEPRAIVEPLRDRRLGVWNTFRQHSSIGHGQYVQRRILAPVLRQSVHDVSSVGRGLPPIHGEVAGARHQRRGVDQHPVMAAASQDELVVVSARGSLLDEEQAPGPLNLVGQHRVAGHLLNSREKRRAAGQVVQDRARVPVLPLEERQPIGILVVFHPAVRIGDRLAEIRVACHLDPRHGRRRHLSVAGRGPRRRCAARCRVRRSIRAPPRRQCGGREGARARRKKVTPIKEFGHANRSSCRASSMGRRQGVENIVIFRAWSS